MQNPPFKDKVILITGASSGIGHELALQLAHQGAKLSLAARSDTALASLATECRQLGGEALAIPTDVSDNAQCKALIEQTLTAFGRIDMLVNNAGVGFHGRFDAVTDLAVIERVMRVNYLGAVACTYYALPPLKETRGRIVNISSVSGKVGVPQRSAYSASKHAMGGFFDALRVELADHGVSVTMVYPDYVTTKFGANALLGDGERDAGYAPKKGLPVDECARLIIEAAAARERDKFLSKRGLLSPWLKLLAPAILDRMAKKTNKR